MEIFKTKLDDNPIEVIVRPNSSAILTGPNKVFMTIYNEDSPINWRKVEVEEVDQDLVFKASIAKAVLVDRPIIRIKSKFAVDDINLKDVIVKNTSLAYSLENDNGNAEDFETNFTDHESEYKTGSSNDETFAVIKRIKIEFL